MRSKSRLLVAAVILAALAAGACSGDDDMDALRSRAAEAGTDGGGGGGSERHMAYDGDEFAPVGTGPLGDTNTATAGGSLPPVGPAVIKTGDLTVQVADGRMQAALSSVVDVARAHGGFVLSTTVDEQGGRSGTVVIRVPAEGFEDALADARDVGEVVREQVSGEDVSQEFVDLDARLRNFEAQESVLLDLMAESSSVADTLRVQRELQDVQLEIERLRGRLRYLRDQTDLSTLTLRIREGDAVVAGTGLFERAWRRSVATFNAIVSAIVVGLSVALPISLLIVLLLLILKVVRPRLPSFGRDG
jgi:hypothetical protein